MSTEAKPVSDSTQIQAVLYDVDGTLYHLAAMRRRMARELLTAALGAPARTVREWRVIQAYRRSQEELRSAGPGQCQYEHAASRLGLRAEDIRPIIEEWMHRRPLRILPGCARQSVLEAIRVLGGCGVRQGVFSDYPAREKLEIFGVHEWIEFGLSSSDPEVGAFKPSPRGFLHAAERWGLDPSRIVYVGDRPEVDGEGARAAGMRFVHADEITADRVRRAAEAGPGAACRALFTA
jgi:putative hydrolase of the HAD superfamily